MRPHPYIYMVYALALLLLAGCGSVDKTIKKGDRAMALGEYCEGASWYKRAYTKIPSKDKAKRGEVAYKMGDAFQRYGYVARALGAFRNADRYGYNTEKSQRPVLLRLGDVQRQMGDYRNAARSYSTLLDTLGVRYGLTADPQGGHLLQFLPSTQLDTLPFFREALDGLTSCAEAPKIKEQGSLYTVKQMPAWAGTRADYCPAFVGRDAQSIVFTTTRPAAAGEELSGITGTKGGDIFEVKKDEKGNWKRPEPAEGDINTDLDEGAASISADGLTMYLTVCPVDAQYPRSAEIWVSKRSDAKWGKAEMLKITADTLSSYAHPAPSPDGRWLYFASDMPGGYGGLDLWRVDIKGGHGVGHLENLGPTINTSGDECFPCVRPNGELYFSSTAHAPNLGGLDLYCAVEDTIAKRWSLTHLPAPMNSNADDFGITFEGLHRRGYFSSNRTTGGRGWDKIFEFSYPEVLQTVKGWVYEQDGYELPDAQVYIVGSDGTNKRVGVLSDGSFSEPLAPGVRYLFLATCKGFLNVRNELQADSMEVEKEHVLQFPLPSISIPVLVRNVFYEFDKADLTDESTAALDRLTAMLKQHPNVTIELAAHCDYRGNDDYNLRLSQRRAESVVRYLTEHGIEPERLTAVGYGETQPKVVNKKLTELHPFLHEGDTLSLAYILALPEDQQEICNALCRRTEFRVLRTTYGLFDESGKLNRDALKKEENP